MMYWVSRVVGHAAWWVFVLSIVLQRVMVTRVTYEGAYEPVFGTGLGSSGSWARRSYWWFESLDALVVISLLALVLVVAAAAVESVSLRGWSTKLANVAVPLVAAAWIVWVNEFLVTAISVYLVLLLMLLGVALREVWARYYAVKNSAVERAR